MFSPDQLINKYSDYNDLKMTTGDIGMPYDAATGQPITPPPGVTLNLAPNQGGTNNANTSANMWPYLQTLARPPPVVTPGPPVQPATYAPNNFSAVLAALKGAPSAAQNAPGYAAPGGGPTPGTSLGGGSSNVSGGFNAGNFINSLMAMQAPAAGATGATGAK
jgi:hypothetical protein